MREIQRHPTGLRSGFGVKTASSAFWNKEDNGWLSKVDTGFHILEKFSLCKKEKGQAVVEKDDEGSYIIWRSDLW